MDSVLIIREGECDPFQFNGEKIYIQKSRPEFFKWTGSKFENVFVGVASILFENNKKVVVYSLPKYFSKERCKEEYLDEIKDILKKICHVAEKMKQEHSSSKIFIKTDNFFEPYKLMQKTQVVNRVELAEYLIEDYVQNGLYIKDITITKKNGKGRTSWGKTVLHTMPIIQNGEAVYLDSINRENIIDDQNIISIIHAKVISQCLELMGPLMANGIVQVENVNIASDNLEQYVQEIINQSSYVFKERDINLLKALEAWCKNTKYYEKYVGIIHFDRLWEWVNDTVWGNTSTLKSGNPKYYFDFEKSYGFRGNGSAIPDTVRIETEDIKAGCKKRVYIFDSKYYILKYLNKQKDNGKDEIIGWPANADIAKQIEYLELLKHLIKQVDDKTYIEYRNAFLLPECSNDLESENRDELILSENNWYKKVGYVEQGVFNELIKSITGSDDELEVEARTVDIIIVKPDVLYNYYLNNRKISGEELLSIWKCDM